MWWRGWKWRIVEKEESENEEIAEKEPHRIKEVSGVRWYKQHHQLGGKQNDCDPIDILLLQSVEAIKKRNS